MRFDARGSVVRLSLVLACVALVAGACGGGGGGETQGEETEGGTLVFGADQDFAGYNTATSKDNSLAGGMIMRQVWASAYRVRPDFSLEPYLLAKEAEVVSEDPFTVEWTIRPDANWSDGQPVSSDDFEFVYTMCNGRTEGADCASTSGYDLIDELEKVDGKTVRATFSQPYSDYKGLFAAVPVHIAKERFPDDLVKGWNNGFDADPGVAVGPFKVESRDRGSSLTLVRNDDFFGKRATLDRIIFRFLPESLSQPAALRNREVNMIYPQPQLDQVNTVGNLSGVHSEINFGPTFEHLTFNFKNEFLAMPGVRQAIAYGVDREAIVERLMKPFSDKASPLHNRVLVATQKGFEPHGDAYRRQIDEALEGDELKAAVTRARRSEVAKAQQALEKAGFTKGRDGIYTRDGKPLRLRLSTTAGNQLREQQGVLIQAQLAEVGFDIRIDNSPSEDLFGDRLPKGNFDIANFAWVGTPFAAAGTNQLYNSGSESNFGKYSNPAVDAKMKESLAILDESGRLAALNDIDEMMWEDLPNLPLYQKPTFLAYEERFENITDNTTTESPFWNSEEWVLVQ